MDERELREIINCKKKSLPIVFQELQHSPVGTGNMIPARGGWLRRDCNLIGLNLDVESE